MTSEVNSHAESCSSPQFATLVVFDYTLEYNFYVSCEQAIIIVKNKVMSVFLMKVRWMFSVNT